MKMALFWIAFLVASTCCRSTKDVLNNLENSIDKIINIEEDILNDFEKKDEVADITEVDIDENSNSPDILNVPTPAPAAIDNNDGDFDTGEDFDAIKNVDKEANDAAAAAGLTEIEVNAMNNFEGDEMILPEEDMKRGVGSTRRLWPRVNGKLKIAYVISCDFTASQKTTLNTYINKMNNHLDTCNSDGTAVWIQRTNEAHYISFVSGNGCSSYLGYIRWAAQPIRLASGCFSGTILHEMLHGMGFSHEQSRSDRDQYVNILFDKIQPNRIGNFRKLASMRSESLAIPYDYGSVLHYPKVAFPIVPGTVTIVPKEAGVTIGQRADMSPSDVLEVKRVYKCPALLLKNSAIQIVGVLSPYYDLSFDIKPIAKISGWSNIIHLTTGGNVQNYGDRAPAVFFHSGTTKLHVCSAISGNSNYCWNSPFQLSLNVFSKIQIRQVPIGAKVYYQIFVNGIQRLNIENTAPRSFESVKAYASDNWYQAAKAYINNYKLVNTDSSLLLMKGNVIQNVAALSSYYDLSFDIKPYAKLTGWSSIIHLTKGGNIQNYGDRTPAVFFRGGTTKLHVCSAISGNKNYCWNSPFELSLNVFSKIRIQQYASGSAVNYRIFVNGIQRLNTANTAAQTFQNVKVYAADPWYQHAEAFMKNYNLVQ